MRQLNSLRSKLILYIALTAILITSVALVLGYFTTRRQLYHQLEARAGALTDQIGYAFEVLIDGDDIFPIQRIIEQTAALEDVFAVAVVDRSGEIVAHNDKSKLGQPLIDPLIPLTIDQEQRVSEFTSDRFVIVDPLTSRNYSLVYHSDVIGAVWIEMDLTTLTAQLTRQYTLLVAVMVGLVSLLSLAALIMLQRLIVNRLRHLQCGLKQVEDGDLTYRLPDAGLNGQGDEITGLVLSFNQMTTALQTRTEQRQKAETSRRASEARMAAMLDTAADAIFTVDTHENIVTFNRGAEEIFGYLAAEIVGQPLEILVPPAIRQKHHQHVEKFTTSVSTSRSMGNRPEIEARHKTGRVFPAEATLAKLEQDGEISFTVILRDITDRKRAEDALRQSEENFRTFFDAVDDYLFILDAQGDIQYFNAAVTKNLGYTPDALMGQHILTVHPPERRDEAGQIVTAMLHGSTDSCPVPVLTAAGDHVPVETRVYHGTWSGEPALFGITKDLSMLKASEEKFARAFKFNPALMAISTIEDGRYVEINNTFSQVIGYSPAEIIGHTSSELNLFRNPAHRQSILDQMLQQGFVRNVEIDIVTKTGQVRHGSFSADVIHLYDGPYLLTVMNDITDRKVVEAALQQSEARNAALLNAIPDLMFIFSDDGTLLNFKSTDDQLLFGSPTEIIGKTINDILPPKVANSTTQAIAQTLETGQIQMFEYQLHFPDGLHTFEARLVVITDNEVLAIVRDISERARLEQMKTDFIHRASHELRTPLTTAMMMVELIREGGPEDELQEYWEILGLEMERQRELIEDLLTVGRLESGNFQLNPVPLSLTAVFENVAPAVTTLAEMRQINFEWHIYPELPSINGDANGLQQVFINLLGNAVKFSPAGETITVWAVPTTGGLLVQVADNGLGIPPDDLPHLFDRFFRAANATRNEIPGSGVGLYIVKSVVEALGGKIFVNSVLDKGTTFVVWLPLATEVSEKSLVGMK